MFTGKGNSSRNISILFFILCSFIFIEKSAAKDKISDISDLNLNDIAYLWPTPKSQDDVNALISADFLINDGELWPEEKFNDVIYFAENKVNGKDASGNIVKISFVSGVGVFEGQLRKRKNWKVVGFRVDPSAPSASPESIEQWGSIPQIRLVLQPVTVNESGVVTIHDMTAHLPFNFVLNTTWPFQPDKIAFEKILNDLLTLKKSQQQMQASSQREGPLNVNSNLLTKSFADQVKAFLHDNLSANRLEFISFMGTANSDQWIFFNLASNALSPNSQLLHVKPSSTSGFVGNRIGNNVNQNFDNCNGISTAVLFNNGIDTELGNTVQCVDSAATSPALPKLQDIPNIIANPVNSNVMNTDCVSCHTESTRRSILKLTTVSADQFQLPELEPYVMDDLLPKDKWNVRNFGWFTKDVLTDPKPIISTRAANETASSLKFIKEHYAN
ncbi:hypothetical protein PTW35_08740 [Photobacterium sp. DA100]|uniref:hypothetical protein n=1 Tax=Photobacterium sp. DA100 TaxID=3027472 RepID=UPI00247B22B3|nr:hypothetical protein [Photobacterium sp. DA100]WEM43845.1 hypothetical protein PTW35_08740 [Photobacterium sp. DA100]